MAMGSLTHSSLPSPLAGEGAPQGRMRGIAISVNCSSAEERKPSPWFFAERKNPVPLPQGARGGSVLVERSHGTA